MEKIMNMRRDLSIVVSNYYECTNKEKVIKYIKDSSLSHEIYVKPLKDLLGILVRNEFRFDKINEDVLEDIAVIYFNCLVYNACKCINDSEMVREENI